jgi:hypothetical protein
VRHKLSRERTLPFLTGKIKESFQAGNVARETPSMGAGESEQMRDAPLAVLVAAGKTRDRIIEGRINSSRHGKC